MNGSRIVLWALLLLIFLPQAEAAYCTGKNWNTGKNLYKKYEDRYNKHIDSFNELLDIYNDFEFYSKKYHRNTFAQIRQAGDTDLELFLENHKTLAFSQVSRLDELIDKINAAKKGLDKSRRLWEKLADYCYDEDEYPNYKAGRNNMRDSIRTIKDADRLIERIGKFRLAYLNEVGLINQTE